MTIDHFAVAANEAWDFEAELADRCAHAIFRGIVLTRILPDFAFFGATLRARLPTLVFLLPFGCSPAAWAWAVSVSSAIEVMACSPLLAVITAVTTSIAPVRRECKWILNEIRIGEGQAM